MSILIAVPQALYPDWMHRPYSEMVAAVSDGTLFDARVIDKAVWDAIPNKDPKEAYGFGGLGTQKRLVGHAIFREGGADFDRPDVAALYMQLW